MKTFESATPHSPQIQSAAEPQCQIELKVDATDLHHHVFHVEETIKVKAGPLKLYFPKWLAGCHSPIGAIDHLCGLAITASDKVLSWRRDPLDVHAFQIEVPQACEKLSLSFQLATPSHSRHGRVAISSEILGVQWVGLILYPADRPTKDISVRAGVKLPPDWHYAGALREERRSDGWILFAPTSVETLCDCPLFAGKYFRREKISGDDKAPVHLNIVADTATALEFKPEQLVAHAKLVSEATHLFGCRHYPAYEFLLALSENFGGIGLEHQTSSENGVGIGYFTEWDKNIAGRDLLPHEYVHSWNGKFRRPFDQTVPNFNTPLQNTLLWVYEGQTQYWGQVLAARSGLWSKEFALDALAVVAAIYDHKRPGRTWRSLYDTTHQPIITPRRPLSLVTWQRTEDYYSEGQLLWLEIDVRIRELTDGRRSLDDFAKAFFGVQEGRLDPLPYTFDDIVATLEAIASYDWQSLLDERLHGLSDRAPLHGICAGGYRLVFKDEPSSFTRAIEEKGNFSDFSYSLGLIIDKDARFNDVVWASPAFDAGLHANMTLVAVNDLEYKASRLKDSIKESVSTKTPIQLLVKDHDRYKTVALSYLGGLRYPALERIEGTKDRLMEILKARE